MIGLSTSWIAGDVVDGTTLLERARRIGVRRLELEYRLDGGQFALIKQGLKAHGLSVGSLHNYCPLPPVPGVREGSGDLFSLASPDNDERALAVRWTLRTIENANDLEALAVVLHCGKVAMEPASPRLREWIDAETADSAEARAFLEAKIAEREAKKGPHWDALRFSLEPLAKAAEKYHVRLGLENRNHHHQLPWGEEFGLLFDEFEGAPLGYWHDTGHAWVNEYYHADLTRELLETHRGRLVGAHLHDHVGWRDHLPPGEGQGNFDSLLEYLGEDALRVMELKPGTPDERVRRAFDFLREKGF